MQTWSAFYILQKFNIWPPGFVAKNGNLGPILDNMDNEAPIKLKTHSWGSRNSTDNQTLSRPHWLRMCCDSASASVWKHCTDFCLTPATAAAVAGKGGECFESRRKAMFQMFHRWNIWAFSFWLMFECFSSRRKAIIQMFHCKCFESRRTAMFQMFHRNPLFSPLLNEQGHIHWTVYYSLASWGEFICFTILERFFFRRG